MPVIFFTVVSEIQSLMNKLVAFNVPQFSDIQSAASKNLLELCLDEQAPDILLLW